MKGYYKMPDATFNTVDETAGCIPATCSCATTAAASGTRPPKATRIIRGGENI